MTPQEARNIYYDEIIDIARKHNIEPWRLVKSRKSEFIWGYTTHPDFTDALSKDCEIQFSYLVLDGIPIFQGDEIYDHLGNKLVYKKVSDMNKEKHMCFLSNIGHNLFYLESNLFLNNPMNGEITLKLKKSDVYRILELLNLFNESVRIDDIEDKLKGALNND